jgi:hypothetical protein
MHYNVDRPLFFLFHKSKELLCSVECVSEACVDFLLQQLTVENAVGFYTYARGYFLPRYGVLPMLSKEKGNYHAGILVTS